MEKLEHITINEIPSLTWNWLKMNRDAIDLAEGFPLAKPQIANSGSKIAVTQGKPGDLEGCCFASGITNKKNPKLVDGKAHFDFVTEDGTHPLNRLFDEAASTTVRIEGKQEKPIVLSLNEDGTYASAQNIIAEEGSESTVILVYEGKAAQSVVRTKLLAKQNSKLHIVKVQLLDSKNLQIDDTAVIAKENAKISFTQIELGGNHVDSGLGVVLEGYKAAFNSNVAYICKGEQTLDMNHIVYHTGKKTECDMKVSGTLLEGAVKTYRGTIDFKNGCTGSKGNEMEEVLLLSPNAVNNSLPVILCDEEDVEGEHGSTIGRLSSETLFYMQSRGISEKEAEKILSRAKIQAAADLICDEAVKEKINNFLDKENK